MIDLVLIGSVCDFSQSTSFKWSHILIVDSGLTLGIDLVLVVVEFETLLKTLKLFDHLSSVAYVVGPCILTAG